MQQQLAPAPGGGEFYHATLPQQPQAPQLLQGALMLPQQHSFGLAPAGSGPQMVPGGGGAVGGSPQSGGLGAAQGALQHAPQLPPGGSAGAWFLQQQ